jgi:exonuclease SbcD
MRILHTSDWHLGKRLFKLDRFDEHEKFLNWLLTTLVEEKIDLLVMTGDVFDSPTPPHQSLELFYQFLSRVSEETLTETLIIAGNHDSGLLLEAPQALLKPHRVKVWGKLSSEPNHHWYMYRKGNEALDICAIPFFRSHELLPQGEGDAIQALKKYLQKEKKTPQLLMLHHLAGMFEAAGSEQVISLSGVDSIPVELLRPFDYVALGHIHKPQRIGPQMHYSGSPLPLRFSETLAKSVVLIELNEGSVSSRLLPLPLFRALSILKVTEADWKKKMGELNLISILMPMVEVQISLSSPKMGLVDEIREALNERGYELLSYLPTYQGLEKQENKNERLFELSPLELFDTFYAHKYPENPQVPDDLRNDFKALLEKVNHASPTP